MTPEDARKLAQAFIVEDLRQRGIAPRALPYDSANIPGWFFFGATDDEFVERSYRLVVNRSPSSEEISNVKAGLAASTLSRAQWLLEVANSAEATAIASRATDHIKALASAELAWQEALVSAELAKQIALALPGGTDDEFVERSYRLVVNRSPSSEEISNVKAGLAAGTLSRAQWLLEAANSAEATAIASRATDHIKALASAELDKQTALAPARRSPFSKILNKLKSSWHASFGRQDQARLDPNIYRASANHLSLMARELLTVREGLNDVRAASADHLSLMARELLTVREGLNDVLRTTHPFSREEKHYDWEKTPALIRSRQSPTELPAVASRRELNLATQRILTELDRRYRGSEQALKAQLEFYLPLIQEISELGTVIDVGCGRGAFLEIMRDHQIGAIGLELNHDHIEECRRKKLAVRQIDALEFVRCSESQQYGAITLFHVIEHLDFETLVAILMEAYRVLVPGGIVLIETPNPENLYVSTYMFKVDPTHVMPITYQYISTVLDVLGFECERLPVRASLHDDDGGETGNRHLNHLLSVSANLSVVARKPRDVSTETP